MNCTFCGVAIPPRSKYLVGFADQPNGGVRIEVGCDHYTPPNMHLAAWIAGGQNCTIEAVFRWLNDLQSKECE